MNKWTDLGEEFDKFAARVAKELKENLDDLEIELKRLRGVADSDRKNMIIDAICGLGFPTMDYADAMTKDGLAEYCGNQWNEDWHWIRPKLALLEEEELDKIYQEASDKRKELIAGRK
jgi:hypothetical protein